ncbi:hypothetical protein Tco_1028480 [Tanacetum coccineum]|uniref:MAK10-like protein n=1 Tax=Tanacetum coccineum TaxID=301880 RepID=A0ABQ5G167_9ASTR
MFRNPFSSTTIGDENPIRTLGDYSKPSHEGYRNTIELPLGKNVVPLRSDTIRWCKTDAHSSDFGLRIQINTSRISLNLIHHHMGGSYYPIPCSILSTGKDRKTPQRYPDVPTTSWRIFIQSMDSRTIDQSAGGKLHDLNAEESWALLEDPALYDNASWNDPRDFAKLVKEIALPQDVPSTSDRRVTELENQWRTQQSKSLTYSCEICSGPHNTQYCMEDPEQAFVKYASSRTDEAGGKWYTFKPEQNNLGDTYNPSWRSHPNLRELRTGQKTDQAFVQGKYLAKNWESILGTISLLAVCRLGDSKPFDTLADLGSWLRSVPLSPNAELVCTKEGDGDVMFIKIISRDDNSHKEEPKPRLQEVEYFDIFPTRSELAYHKYLMCGPILSIFLQNPIIIEGRSLNLEIP